MAFEIHTVDYGQTAPWEYLPSGAITPEVGKAMVLTGGALAVASGTTKPTHICMRHEDAAVESGTILPVVKADPAIIWETTFSAAADSVAVGDQVTLSDDGLEVTGTTTSGVATVDGLEVTGTTTSGVATVVWIEGTAAGDRVRVRFE